MKISSAMALAAFMSIGITLAMAPPSAVAARGDARLEYYGVSIDTMIADFMQ